MKKNITHKLIDKSKDKIPSISGFMLETPIYFDDFELGTLKINFDLKKERTSPNQMHKNRMLLIHLADELGNYVPFLRKKLEFELGLRFKYSEQIDQLISRKGHDIFTLIMLMPLYYVGKRTMSPLGLFLYEKENEIFELIKSEGPIILCHPIVQEKIEEWLSDKDIASVRATKLKDSLLEYAFGESIKDRISKIGRSEIESIRKLGKSRIKFFYHSLTDLFQEIKKNKENYKGNSIKEIIEDAGKNIYISFSKRFSYSDKITEKQIVGAIKKLDKFFSTFEEKFYIISAFIENDEDLKRKFYRFRWQPNKIAKEIIGKILDISVDTVESILYR